MIRSVEQEAQRSNYECDGAQVEVKANTSLHVALYGTLSNIKKNRVTGRDTVILPVPCLCCKSATWHLCMTVHTSISTANSVFL